MPEWLAQRAPTSTSCGTCSPRPAGFRTHALVCMASSSLMLVTVYQGEWFTAAATEIVRVDPTRMAQGVMTGIGFLGAGVIMKEGMSTDGSSSVG